MTQTTNSERVRTYFRLVDANKLDEMFDMFADEIVYRRAGIEPIIGKEALVAFFKGPRGIREIAHEIEVVSDQADCVVVEGRARASLVDGGSFDLRFADFFWFRDGVIVRRHGYMDLAP